MEHTEEKKDMRTAQAFASSWNNLPTGSVYTLGQFIDWMEPITKEDLVGKDVLELGCGNASLMTHMSSWPVNSVVGVDLGDSVLSARENLKNATNAEVVQGDLTTYEGEKKFDLVYCIGVLHHLKEPQKGFNSVVRNTKPGGKFHCWVYAKEGNLTIRLIVEPIRFVTAKLPWWFTKYFVATPLVAPFYVYAKLMRALPKLSFLKSLPLYEYALWIGKRNFAFFRHVAFDQLVTPQTAYISKEMIESWFKADASVKADSTYIIKRNGNSWKFGGTKVS